jgi:excisionase family DNA binding protein
MFGERLHEYDVRLCRHALDNVGSNMRDPAFAGFVKKWLDPAVFAYMQALDGDVEPPPLLLNDEELDDLAGVFDGEEFQFDHDWIAYEGLYRRSIDCVAEIRDGLAKQYADEWASLSAQFAERLEASGVWLHEGIDIVREWAGEVRRLLRAMGATNLLPAPEGTFPTPTNPEPPPSPAAGAATAPGIRQGEDDLRAAIAETQALQREIRDLLINQRTVKEVYTTAEVADILGRSEYTVREWARKGQVQAGKAPNGRSWLISHAELTRLRNHGPSPEHQADGVVDRRGD